MRVVPCGPERAEDVHRLTQAAYALYARLDPPSGALRETVERVRADLAAGGGALAHLADEPVACLRWQVSDAGDLHVRRVAVQPDLQRRGIGRTLMRWAEDRAAQLGCAAISVGVRAALPGNLAFYESLGFTVTGAHRHEGYVRTTWLSLRKPLRS